MSRNDQIDTQLVDREQMGRLIRAARTIAGFDRVEDVSQAINETTGVRITTRTLYALERGEQQLTIEQFFAIMWTLRPPGMFAFFWSAYRDDLRLFVEGYEGNARRGNT